MNETTNKNANLDISICFDCATKSSGIKPNKEPFNANFDECDYCHKNKNVAKISDLIEIDNQARMIYRMDKYE